MDNYADYQINIEENVELRKAIAQLEDIIVKKNAENDNLMTLYDGMKRLNEKTIKENLELNEKLMQTFDEKKRIEKLYEVEIKNLNQV
jgi:hypothetical protein